MATETLNGKEQETLTAKRTDIFNVPFELTEIDETHKGLRHSFEDIEELANTIRQHGILTPTRGYKRKDGKYIIVHGNRRWQAAKLLHDTGVSVSIPVQLIGRSVDDERYLIETFIGNEQKPLKPLEQAEGIAAFSELGYKNPEIAEKTGLSQAYVGQLLRLHNAPAKFKKLVQQEKLSATTARKILQKGDNAAQEFLEKWESEGDDALLVTGGEGDKGAGRSKEKYTEKDISINSWSEFKKFAKAITPKDVSNEYTANLRQVFNFLVKIQNNELEGADFDKFFKIGK